MEKKIRTIAEKLTERLKSSEGVQVFVKRRARFEDWVKLELVEIINEIDENALPEVAEIDIQSDNWAVEIKVIPTNYACSVCDKRGARSIHTSIQGLIKDFKKLKATSKAHKVSIAIVYPLTEGNQYWQRHLNKLEPFSDQLYSKPVVLPNKAPLFVYIFKPK